MENRDREVINIENYLIAETSKCLLAMQKVETILKVLFL